MLWIRSLDTAPRSIGVLASDHWIQHPKPDVLVTAAVKKAEGQTDNTVQIQEQSANIHSKQAPTSGNQMKGHRQPSPCSFDTPFRQQTFPRTIPGWNSLPEDVVDSPISGLLCVQSSEIYTSDKATTVRHFLIMFISLWFACNILSSVIVGPGIQPRGKLR